MDSQVTSIVSRMMFEPSFARTLDSFRDIESSPLRRRLFDEFGDSLRFVSSLLNSYFGKISRKVIAHMPHLINVEIMEELQQKWETEFDVTSSHRFRHKQDIQYAFAYFYYLVQASVEFDPVDFFETQVDIDGDGFVSTLEMQRLKSIYSAKLVDEAQSTLVECKDSLNATSAVVQLSDFLSCERALTLFRNHFQKQKKYAHDEGKMSHVTFYMMRNNVSVVEKRLDEILEERKKFVCLNDDTDNPPPEFHQVLSRFFEKYYPEPSPFEYPPGIVNEILHVRKDISASHPLANHQFFYSGIVIGLGFILLVLSVLCRPRASDRDHRGKLAIE